MHIATWYLYPYYDIENPELFNWNMHLKPGTKNNNIISSNTPSWTYQILVRMFFLERDYFYYLECSYNTWYVYNDKLSIYGPEPRSPEGNTSSNPQVSALIPRPASNGMDGEDVSEPWE